MRPLERLLLLAKLLALAGIRYFAQVAVFVLDQLEVLNRTDPNGILGGKLNLRRAGAFGVSLGGIVAAQACHLAPRLKACLMMDAPMPVDVVNSGLQQPSMWITRDCAGMRLERQRAGGWPEKEIRAHQALMRAVYQSLPGAGYFAVAGESVAPSLSDRGCGSHLITLSGDLAS